MSETKQYGDRLYREAPLPTAEQGALAEVIARTEALEAKLSRPSPVKLTTWEDIERFAEKASRSGMVPQQFQGKPDAIAIAVQMGSELGLAPMQAIQNIAVIGNRPAIWGDALPGLCRASGMMRTMREWSEGEGDAMEYFCEAVRRDDPQVFLGAFSVSDAIRAGLWGGNVWKKYPKRMLQMRSRGFCLRDAFPDVLKGLITVEEAQDIPEDNRDDFIPARRASSVVSQIKQEAPAEERWIGLFVSDEVGAAKDSAEWLTNLGKALLTATAPQIAEIAAISTVVDALEKAPSAVKSQIKAMFAGANERVSQPTPTEFLATLRGDLEVAGDDGEAVDAILARADVQKAQDTYRNGDKKTLDFMIAAAIERTKAEETSAPNDEAGE
jgi:hypothetical protein